MYLSPERSISEHLKFPKIEKKIQFFEIFANISLPHLYPFSHLFHVSIMCLSCVYNVSIMCLSCVYPYSWFSLMTNSDVLHQPPWVKNDLDAEHFAADDGTIFCSGGWRKRQVH